MEKQFTDKDVADFNSLMHTALGNDAKALEARKMAREMIGLDESNWCYFFNLWRIKKADTKRRSIRIYEENGDTGEFLTAYPIAIAPEELKKSLEVVEYRDLRSSKEDYSAAAKRVSLWTKKMQAGSGSSLSRTTYLANLLGISESQVRIGAKGTDLQIELSDPKTSASKVNISIAEAQILQSIAIMNSGEVGEVVFHDIVSSETEDAFKKLWEKKSVFHDGKTYRAVVNERNDAQYFGTSFQSYIPTIDEQGRLSFNRKAPGGHALFAVDALRAAYQDKMRPTAKGALIAAISNGEDLNSSPDPYMLGYVARHQVPIALVTTERTAVDLKGGLLSLLVDKQRNVSLTVLETAQASEVGQDKLFASLAGMVSTNLTIFNYEVLVPLLTKEVNEIGEDEFLKVITPDLISNVKEQRDKDGVNRKYVQLEGTMGSTIMNLDRYWRKKYGKALVHIINVDKTNRTDFFSPIKSAFDYFMQFRSDRFYVDSQKYRLKNRRPGELPAISLKDRASKDKYYQDVVNVLRSFEGASIIELDALEIEGKVNLRGVKLAGKVKVSNDKPTEERVSESVLQNVTLNLGAG